METLYLKLTVGEDKLLVGKLTWDGISSSFEYLSFDDGKDMPFENIQYLPLKYRRYEWNGFPAAFDEMVIRPDRPDIRKVLKLYGMDRYDQWEYLKRSKGTSPTNFWAVEENDDGVRCKIITNE